MEEKLYCLKYQVSLIFGVIFKFQLFHVKSNYLLDTGLMQTTFNDITKITFVTNKIGVIVTGT